MRHCAAACRLDGRAMAVRHSCLALMSSPGQSVLAVYGAVVSELGLRPQPLTCCLLLFRSWTSATAAAKRAPQQLIYTVLAFGALWLQARLRNLQCRMPPAYACAGAALLLHWWPARQAVATCAFLVIPPDYFQRVLASRVPRGSCRGCSEPSAQFSRYFQDLLGYSTIFATRGPVCTRHADGSHEAAST